MQYLQNFQKDEPCFSALAAPPLRDLLKVRIDGCSAIGLNSNSDHRGHLIELLTTRDSPIDPIVHVYQVFAEPHSIRAWIFHAVQTDRLCFTEGRFRVVLFDIRENSPTFERYAELIVGEHMPVRLTIPPFVVHGVQNLGETRASYLNMPDRVYNLMDPDKYRVPADSSLIDFAWEAVCLQS
ncbi:MAG: dTDP-4-dehydrorhamnose 3,5-epimerase family protein [Bryobacteraceae bacterium]